MLTICENHQTISFTNSSVVCTMLTVKMSTTMLFVSQPLESTPVNGITSLVISSKVTVAGPSPIGM